MLKSHDPRGGDELLQRVQESDPAATLDQSDTEVALLLDRILAGTTQPLRSHRRARARFRIALTAVVVAAALLVPAAIGFHSQLLDVLRKNDQTPSFFDLNGTWTVHLTRMKPAQRDGRWTLTFTPYRNVPGFFGAYAMRHNGNLVARGTLGYDAPNAQIHLLDMNGPNQCNEEPIGGTYHVALQQHTITLEPFRDICAKRRAVLAGRSFERR
jgi:hypothetical protein